MKYVIKNENDVEQSQTLPNALSVLLASQASRSQPGRPPVVEERNAKDQLHNAILGFLEEQGLDWHSDEVDTQGKTCIQKLTDVLWTLDGHQSVLAKQSYKIPEKFQGYNTPERHKL